MNPPLAGLVIPAVLLGCSAGGHSPDLIVGKDGSGGSASVPSGNSGGAIILPGDAAKSNPFSAHIESPPGVTVEIITLSCSNECADVVAVAKGGFAPYSFRWEDGSVNAARRVCPTSATIYRVSVTDTGRSSGEHRRDPETVSVPLTVTMLTCPHDGGVSPEAGTCAPLPPNATLPVDLTPDIFNEPTHFFGGTPLPAGRYRVAYVDGCMKYDANWTWTVHGSPNFQFLLIGAATTDVLGVLPGTFAPIAFGVTGYASYDDCVAANRALPPLDFDFAGGALGLWQNDVIPADNIAGATSPTWRLSRLDRCP